MEIKEFSTVELINIMENNEIVGRGNYGIVYKLDNDRLFKLFYADFKDYFDFKNRTFDYSKLDRLETSLQCWRMNEEMYKNSKQNVVKLIDRQKSIKLTQLTKGLVYVNGYCVGYLLKNHQNMQNLLIYLSKNLLRQSDTNQISKNINKAVKELLENYIYITDLSKSNVLLNPNTNEIQLIDFEDKWTKCKDSYNDMLEHDVIQKENELETDLYYHTIVNERPKKRSTKFSHDNNFKL